MNQDKDDILALRVESTPKPVKVEVRRVAPTMTKEQAVEVERRLQQAAAQRAMTPAEQFAYGGMMAARQQAPPLTGPGSIFGGIV